MTAAQKAHVTLAARRAFTKKYGTTATAIVLALLENNETYLATARAVWGTGTVAAYKANLNRFGNFRNMALDMRSRAKK